MPKQGLKQKFKQSIGKIQPTRKETKEQPKKQTDATTNIRIKKTKFQLPKIITLKKKKVEIETTTPSTQSLPKGLKIIDKYPLYEPFAQVAIVQDPKTGEHKYILDELKLDPMEQGIYNRIIEMLLAEIESP